MKRMKWFAIKYKHELAKGNILDVGSYNVNGCYREIFTQQGIMYEGLDMEAGPNVDIVPKATYNWEEIDNDSYDAVISGQALEHIEFFWLTIGEMVRVTKENGLICIIAPNGFGEHRYPVDCWRFFTDGMVALARYFELEILHAHTNASPDIKDEEWYSENCADAMLIARKTYKGKARKSDLRNYKCIPSNHKKLMGEMKTYKEYLEFKNSEFDKNKMVEKKNRADAKSKNLIRMVIGNLLRYKNVIEKIKGVRKI